MFQYRDHIENTSHIKRNEMSMQAARIISYMRQKYPHLLGEMVKYIPCKALPILVIKSKSNKKSCYLFGVIPMFSYKKKSNSQTLIKIFGIPIIKIKAL